MNTLGRIAAKQELHKSMRSRIIRYMYLQYNTAAEFWPQFEKNVGLLWLELKNAMAGNQKKNKRGDSL